MHVPILTIIRGLPGSGKSTLAKSMGCLHIEADMFHIKGGVYCFSKGKVRNAHAECLHVVRSALFMGCDVAVSNTFTTLSEFEPYIKYAIDYGYTDIRVIRCTGNYGSVHNVPQNILDAMAARFQDYKGEVLQ